MTGIQALERAAPTLPMRPGQVERREFEFESVRHGTQCLIANCDVVAGRIVTPTVGPTRPEADFATHVAGTIATAPDAEWVFRTDQTDHLNTHQSESLVRVRLVATRCEITDDLGVKDQAGSLQSAGHAHCPLAPPSSPTRPTVSASPLRVHPQALLLAQSTQSSGELVLDPGP